MSEPFQVRRVVHAIHAVNDHHAARVRYMNVLGALVFAENYVKEADRDMNLFYVADFMIEPMSPRRTPGEAAETEGSAAMARIYANYLDRHGEGWHSFELAVDDLPSVIASLSDRNIRTSPGVPFVHPRDAFGFCIELIPGDLSMPGDPINYSGWNRRWFEGNPMSLTSLGAIIHTVTDVKAATEFLVDTWGAAVLSEDNVDFPEKLGRTRVELAGTEFLLVAPSGTSGPITDHIARDSYGIYSLAWKVRSLKQAQERLHQLGVRTVDTTAIQGGISIEAADMFGARHEFYEA